MKSVLVGLTVVIAAIGIATGQASATTITQGSQVSPNTNGQLIVTGVTLGIGVFAPVNAPISTGANLNSGWDPWGSTDTNSHWMGVGGAAGGTSFAVFNGDVASNVFTLLWGSPNPGNSIKFYDQANGQGNLVATVLFDGGFKINGVVGPQPFGPNSLNAGFVESITTTTLFLSAVLTNPVGGFEVADISAGLLGAENDPPSTPLPAALPMFMGGAGLIGLLARRGKRKRAA